MKNNRFSPLLVCGVAALMGTACATKIVKEAENGAPNAPKVVAVYAVDNVGPSAYCTETNPASPNAFAFCGSALPDVLVYSTVAADAAKASKAPPAYGAFRVEFDQVISGTSISGNNDFQSFCSPVNKSVQLLDGTQALASSVCYDPSSALGQNPHVLVTVGNNTAFAPGTNPFTCQAFNPDIGLDSSGAPQNNGLTLQKSHAYSFAFSSGITGSNGKAIDPSSGPINFNTAGFEIMAVGYQDQNTGYFVWLDKPYKGFMKDLDPVTDFKVPADDTSLLVVTTMPIKTSVIGNGLYSVDDINVTRADGSNMDGGAILNIVNLGPAASDPTKTLYASDFRVAAPSPGNTWEPGVKYSIQIMPTMQATDGTPLPASQVKTYTVQAADGSYGKRTSSPANGAIAVNPSVNSSVAGRKSNIIVQFTVPVDTTLLDNTHFKLTDGSGANVPLSSVVARAGFDQEALRVFPAIPTGETFALRAGTKYTLTTTGLKTPPACSATVTSNCVSADLASKPIADSSITFTTASFRIQDVYDPKANSAPSPAAGTHELSINNSGSLGPSRLISGRVEVRFTEIPDPSTVSNASLKLFELPPTGSTTAPKEIPATITATTASDGTARDYIVAVQNNGGVVDPAVFKLKFGTTYAVKALTTIKEQNHGALAAEGCTTGDCTDVRTFRTRVFAPALFAADDQGIYMLFSGTTPFDASTLGTLASKFHLYQVDASGNRTEVFKGTMSCAPASSGVLGGGPTTEIDCAYPNKLTANTNYVATAIFTNDAPIKAAPTITSGGVTATTETGNGVPGTGQYFGSSSTTFLSSCTP